VHLPLTTLIAAIDMADLGEPHVVLAGAERFISRRVRHESDRIIRDQLAAAGLTTGDRLTDDFTDTLTTIQRGTVEYYGWVTGVEVNYALLAAARGSDAVILKRTHESVHIERPKPKDMVAAFLAQLPSARPARAAPIFVPRSEPARRGLMVANRPSRKDDRVRLVALMKEPRTSGSMLYCARRDHAGTRRRSPTWITVVDARSGRWIIYVTPDGAVNVVPGTQKALTEKLVTL
jgi:hypothetical protein